VATVAKQAVRGAITNQSGGLVFSGNPAKLGQYYTIWLTGLRFVQGIPNPDVSIVLQNIPVYGLLPTYAPVVPSFVGASPQFPGLFQVNFQLPSNPAGFWGYSPWPCGTYRWELDLSLYQGGNAQTVLVGDPVLFQIPVSVNPSDVACTPVS